MNRSHGRTKTTEYKRWQNMMNRCMNPLSCQYADYGGRGITVAPEFQTFEGFYAHLGDCPPGLTLDRIDNNDSYRPGNVRWTTHRTQMANRRNNLLFTIDGKTQCLAAWCRERGIDDATVEQRLKRGLPIETALRADIRYLHLKRT